MEITSYYDALGKYRTDEKPVQKPSFITGKKVYFSLAQEILLRKKQTYFRSYLFIWLLQDEINKSLGSIPTKVFLNDERLDISLKTRYTHLKQLEQIGWLNIANDQIYFRSQEKLTTLLECSTTRKAIYVTFEDVSTKNKFKNWIVGSVIALSSKRPIARKTLQEKFVNLSPRTQRKYEGNIEKTFNYAILGGTSNSKESDKDVAFVDGNHYFYATINGRFQLLKQIPNLYDTLIKTGKRFRTKHVPFKKAYPDTPATSKLYLTNDAKPNKNTNNNYYRKTRMSNSLGNLWFKESIV